MSGRRTLGSSSGSGSNTIMLFEPGDLNNFLGNLEHRRRAERPTRRGPGTTTPRAVRVRRSRVGLSLDAS
jgi:hypothetical protein